MRFSSAIAMIFLNSVALAQNASPSLQNPRSWRPVVYSDLQLPGPNTASFAAMWADEINKNNEAYIKAGDARYAVANAPVTESHVIIRSPTKTVVLSTLNTLTACKIVATSMGGYATLKRCPMRMAIYEAQNRSINDAGTGCYLEYTKPLSSNPDPTQNLTYTSYDIVTKEIRLGIIFDKAGVDDCQFNIAVPQSNEK